jgi:hypothetical protein
MRRPPLPVLTENKPEGAGLQERPTEQDFMPDICRAKLTRFKI